MANASSVALFAFVAACAIVGAACDQGASPTRGPQQQASALQKDSNHDHAVCFGVYVDLPEHLPPQPDAHRGVELARLLVAGHPDLERARTLATLQCLDVDDKAPVDMEFIERLSGLSVACVRCRSAVLTNGHLVYEDPPETLPVNKLTVSIASAVDEATGGHRVRLSARPLPGYVLTTDWAAKLTLTPVPGVEVRPETTVDDRIDVGPPLTQTAELLEFVVAISTSNTNASHIRGVITIGICGEETCLPHRQRVLLPIH